MLFYTKNKVDLMQQNVIVIEDIITDTNDEGEEEQVTEGYIVTSKDVYDAAVILSERYAGSVQNLERKVMSTRHQDIVNFFSVRAPKPINMLAPFLHLAEDGVKMRKDVRDLCGYLHVITSGMDVLAYVSVPEDVRIATAFSPVTLGRFEEMWEALTLRLSFAELDPNTITLDFMKSFVKEVCLDIIDNISMPQSQPQVVYAPPVQQPVYAASTVNQSEYVDEDDEDDEEAALQRRLEAIFAETNASLEELDANKDNEEVDEVVTEAEEPEVEEQPVEEVDPEKEAIANIIALYGGGR